MEKSTSVSFHDLNLTVFISLLAWPIVYIANNVFGTIDQTVRPFWMMIIAFLILGSAVVLIAKCSYTEGWVYYGAVLFAFTAIIDLTITLEFNGVIHNFMSEYLKLGEPYLASPWGSVISLFDGTGLYIMYLLLVYLISNGKDWRSLGIYWAFQLIHSMIVLVSGVLTGNHSPTFCSFLNIPYVVFPIASLFRTFNDPRPNWITESKGIKVKIVDLLLAAGLAGCMVIEVAKGIAAFASDSAEVDFLGFLKHEPSFLLNDPAPFSAIQSGLYLLYIVPIQGLSFLCCFSQHKPQYLWELTLIQSGIAMQGQFSVIGVGLDPQTPPEFQSSWGDGYFWLYNLWILIVPHLFLIRLLLQHDDKSVTSRSPRITSKDKTRKNM